jgi:cell division transport system permease protein
MFVMISRPIKEGFSGVGRHLAMAISSAIAVTITLIIISLFIIFSYNVQNFTKNIESSMEISVMVDYNYEDSAKEDAIQKSIEAIDGVKKVTYSNKDQEFQYYIDSFDDEKTKEAFEPFKDDNPMHDAFYVEAASGDQITEIASEIQKIEGVAEVNYGGQSTVSMVDTMAMVRKIGGFLVIGLTLLAIFLIQNTIKLTISARKDEITIMRNVGATNSFIRSPFVIEGIIIGVLGSIIPIALTVWGYTTLYQQSGGVLVSNMFKLVKPNPYIFYLAGILLGIGVVVGFVGSLLSVNRYLRWKR